MNVKKITVRGNVHDVGYRLFLLTEAESLLIEHFDARNIVVEDEQQLVALVGGPEEKINRFLVFARSRYPADASVLAVDVEEYPEEIRGIDSFRQSFMVSQMAKLVQVGVGMLTKQDMMLEKQDETINAIREESEKTRVTVKEESKKTRDVIIEGSEKTRDVIKGTIEEDVEWHKAEIMEMKATLGKVKERVGMV
jgi:acylphosphatase